jgi:hypothetical protein
MSCEPKFVMVDPPMRGVPNPRYFKPLVRINAQTQDAPFNWMLDPCYLDMQAIADAIGDLLGGGGGNQRLSFDSTTNLLSISGGNTVDISQVTPGVEPSIMTDASIPTAAVGTDDYLLGKPDAWGRVVVGGVAYNIPLYL